ncbi:hypothetical protein QNO08_17205 (plasmid) [Arthrobacter sp. zg-Y820]|uniref:hypothetical protein n=1 Tax=unclassified Arthrobacter TaxID=235627 RepID=UPI001E581E10|nr:MULTISPECIES: hypothetical protein [unclassified Arthrobacter]MCC9198533.1 hypothetical protein [Arthrobacter sp. zg-Y820]MDK1281403.1 hypothetical protein [Arthrobacter sp. zg.Y820]WIB11253.1 hypothetical protein QNO08_17205 [Arthrobacter sp. zg-Y820]
MDHNLSSLIDSYASFATPAEVANAAATEGPGVIVWTTTFLSSICGTLGATSAALC